MDYDMKFSISSLVSTLDPYQPSSSAMEIPIKDDVYIWANYSVSCYRLYKRLNMIEIRFYAPSFLVLWHIFFETTAQIPEVIFASWTKATLLRIYFRNLSVQRSFLQYKSQCLKKVNVKYVINGLWHEIFHIVYISRL
jgi:hypothetical protein